VIEGGVPANKMKLLLSPTPPLFENIPCALDVEFKGRICWKK
jgi:hypothetical protein